MLVAEATLWSLFKPLKIQPKEKLAGQLLHSIVQHSELRLGENIIHQLAGPD